MSRRDSSAESTALVNNALIAFTALPETMAWRSNSCEAITIGNKRRIQVNVPGTPDITGLTNGWAWVCECKWGSGRLNDNQRRFRSQWLFAGGIYILLRMPGNPADDVLPTFDFAGTFFSAQSIEYATERLKAIAL